MEWNGREQNRPDWNSPVLIFLAAIHGGWNYIFKSYFNGLEQLLVKIIINPSISNMFFKTEDLQKKYRKLCFKFYFIFLVVLGTKHLLKKKRKKIAHYLTEALCQQLLNSQRPCFKKNWFFFFTSYFVSFFYSIWNLRCSRHPCTAIGGLVGFFLPSKSREQLLDWFSEINTNKIK